MICSHAPLFLLHEPLVLDFGCLHSHHVDLCGRLGEEMLEGGANVAHLSRATPILSGFSDVFGNDTVYCGIYI